MDWPAYSPDLNPIEHVWDMLGRRIAARQPPPTCLPELRRALLDEWCNIPQDQIDNLILSMPRRSMLAKNFKKYFLDEDSLVASYEWIRDLFQDTPEGLSTSEEEIFIDFAPSEKLKGNFVINRSLNLG
ncbi:kinesin-like protein [Trichonephila clavipes]|nr:kinesin-like protein [Trichonephila clavipes]